MDDELLLKKACQGDIDAFEQIAGKYQAKIYGLCLRLLKNEFDAGDAAQETLLKLYKNLGKFSGRSAFGTWVYALTKNVCLDFIRKNRRTLENIDDKTDLASGEFDPLAAAEASERALEIRRLLERLPPEQKSALTLKDIDGYTYEEIAGILNISIGTVRSRIARGRQKMRNLIKEYKSL